MTPLEQFNEEVMKEFNILMEGIVIADTKEPAYVDNGFISYFFTQKLTEHKALILKMVRERAPKLKNIGEETYCQTCKQHKAAGECDCIGFNKGVQEFLNNLDTI